MFAGKSPKTENLIDTRSFHGARPPATRAAIRALSGRVGFEQGGVSAILPKFRRGIFSLVPRYFLLLSPAPFARSGERG